MERALPFVMIALSVLSAVVYAAACDWRHAGYWLAAAVLTLCVTV